MADCKLVYKNNKGFWIHETYAQLVFQFIGVSLYLYLIDRLSGNVGWALNYAVPFIYIAVTITETIMLLIKKPPPHR